MRDDNQVRPVVRCPHCELNQFVTRTRHCRRCGESLFEGPKLEVVQPVASSAATAGEVSTGVAVASRRPLPASGLDFAGAVRVLRLARGLSQFGLAERLGCRRTYISKIENVRCQPVVASIRRVAAALEVSAFELVELSALLGRAEQAAA